MNKLMNNGKNLNYGFLLTLGRSIVALGQLTVILFTPLSYLQDQIAGSDAYVQCSSFYSDWNILCNASIPDSVKISILSVILIFVISGYYPRISSILHFLVSITIYSGITLADGGESAAIVTTFWIAIIGLFDGRKNGWTQSFSSSKNSSSLLFTISLAGALFLKIQCSLMYFHASVSKMSSDTWVDGTAMYYIIRMEMFGASPPFRDFMIWFTSQPVGTVVATHGTLVAELFIALSIWGNRNLKACAIVLSVLLHVSIIFILGISSFALVMIGLVISSASAYSWVVFHKSVKYVEVLK